MGESEGEKKIRRGQGREEDGQMPKLQGSP